MRIGSFCYSYIVKQKKLVNVIFGLLIVQFILGMLANLYATVPTQKPYEVFHQVGYINLHAINGTLLLILSVVLVVKLKHQPAFKQALGGAINVVLAFTFGELFVFLHNDIFSLLMALAFIGALLSYARLALQKQSSKGTS